MNDNYSIEELENMLEEKRKELKQQERELINEKKKNKPIILPDEIIINNLPELKKLIKEYIDFIASNEFYEDNDFDHYIYELVMTIFCGQAFWDWYNSLV